MNVLLPLEQLRRTGQSDGCDHFRADPYPL